MSPRALAILGLYAWPDNVWELEHCLAHLVAISDQPLLDAAMVRATLDLPPNPRESIPEERRRENKGHNFDA